MCLLNKAIIYYATNVFCMVQHIYIVTQLWRNYNTLNVKNSRKIQRPVRIILAVKDWNFYFL